MLTLQEHSSASYSPRTYTNAASSDLTAAFAVDFKTAGERLTKKMAGHRYVGIPLLEDPIEAARTLYRAVRVHNVKTLNVAGNGIYTLCGQGWSQAKINQWIFDVISKVHEHHPLTRIRSGGQAGVDLAGLVAGNALGITTIGYFPKGFIQRGEDKVDREHLKAEVRDQIERFTAQLSMPT